MAKEEIETAFDVARREILKRLKVTEPAIPIVRVVTVDTGSTLVHPLEGSTVEGRQILASLFTPG